ncbi:hypothetical protein HPB52_012431 [Rhipicephalus sanguineus]|uniref:Uncharacterized protein n=1 Tax=Rhipicephalus sanguineus TaxID=34632 RepID=A0A9D4PJB4_RHISA|nr:hypothetical protein HPB52_012431 [Rhipicephalus sanguineus]
MQRVASKFGRFTAVFRERPLVANMVTYPTLYVAAEFTQQTILMSIDETRRRRGYDWKIMLRYMSSQPRCPRPSSTTGTGTWTA